MDTDSAPELDFSKADREVYLVQIPPHLAAQWAECDFDDELGTIVFPTDTSKPTNFFLYGDNTKPHMMQPRTIHKQTNIIGEAGADMSVEGRVKQLYEVKMPKQRAPAQNSMQVDSGALHIINFHEDRALQDIDRSGNDVSMQWAGGRKLDATGKGELFVQRPKHEVVQDLIELFRRQDKYTFEDLSRQLQQPKNWLTEILSEYTTTETEYGKRQYRLRPEFRSAK